MVMRQRQIDGLIETNKRRVLPGCFPPGSRKSATVRGEYPKEP